MKKSLYLIVCAAALLVLGSCQKLTTEGMTRTTYYPIIELEGDNPYVISKGGSYSEPGFIATLNGEDVSSSVKIESDVNTNELGIYTVSYSAVNPDGFSAKETRSVYVTNPGHFDNIYLSSCKMGSRSYADLPIIISEYAPGVYLIEDLCGGYYCYGRYPGYEPTYDFHAEALLVVEDDNSLSIVGKGSWYFVNSFDYSNFYGSYDPETGIIDYFFDDLYVTLVPIG